MSWWFNVFISHKTAAESGKDEKKSDSNLYLQRLQL